MNNHGFGSVVPADQSKSPGNPLTTAATTPFRRMTLSTVIFQVTSALPGLSLSGSSQRTVPLYTQYVPALIGKNSPGVAGFSALSKDSAIRNRTDASGNLFMRKRVPQFPAKQIPAERKAARLACSFRGFSSSCGTFACFFADTVHHRLNKAVDALSLSSIHYLEAEFRPTL